ncbi:F-box protein CPR1-like [Bidens hawaiensis]|uniref:F-box protein CPR1-like n=1 Tax=Bidens hawaiensis TaxID=980011 RepID=UPI00404B4825
MPANIPFEIQEEILKHVLSTKSLIRFRSVSKPWKSLIDGSEFVTRHHKAQPLHLLIMYRGSESYEDKFVLVADDDCFPDHKFSPIDCPIVKSAAAKPMLDCSHGLVCLLGYHRVQRKSMMVLWNPSIRKSVNIPVPSAWDAYGFGVCPKTSDPKIVRIAHGPRQTSSMDRYAEVFTLSSGVWRRVLMNSQFKFLHFSIGHHAIIGGVIYWVAYEYDHLSNTIIMGLTRSRIISFDLESEEFGEVELPDSLVGPDYHLYIAKLKESLVVLNYRKRYPGGQRVCDAWMSENGVSKSSFTKLFTFQDNSSNASKFYRIIGFRTNGQPIIKLKQIPPMVKELEVYDPRSKHLNGIGIYGYSFEMTSYTESLLLLNHSNSMIKS